MRREQLRAIGLGLVFAALAGIAAAAGCLAVTWALWFFLNP